MSKLLGSLDRLQCVLHFGACFSRVSRWAAFFQVYKKASYHFEAVISCVVVVSSEGESDTAQQTVADDLWQVARA